MGIGFIGIKARVALPTGLGLKYLGCKIGLGQLGLGRESGPKVPWPKGPVARKKKAKDS